MLDLFHRTDWSSTPFGPVESWPPNLRFLVDVCLSSALPHARLLGAGAAHALQRRLPRPARREQAPSGVGLSRTRGLARGLGRHRTHARGRREWWAGDVGRGRAARRRPQRPPRGGLLHVVLRRRPRRHRRGHLASSTSPPRRRPRCWPSAGPTCPPDFSPPWPTPRMRRTCVAAASTCCAPTTTTTSRVTCRWAAPGEPGAGRRRRRGSHGPRRARRRAGRRRAHRAPAADREPPPAVGPDAPACYAEVCASHVAMALSGIRHLEEERRRTEVLTELDVAKSDFFAERQPRAATPLTLIAGPVQDALADSDGLDAVQRQRFELIRRNTDRLTGLVDRILDLTRVEAGAVEPHWVEADVEELVAGIAANFRPAIEHSGLEFDVVCDELDHEAYVDVDMFERIVLNLLANALKFTARGRIALRLSGSDEGYAVSVTDTGIGIAEKDLDLVFDRFRQLDRGDGPSARERVPASGCPSCDSSSTCSAAACIVRSARMRAARSPSPSRGVRRRRTGRSRPSIRPPLGGVLHPRGQHVGGRATTSPPGWELTSESAPDVPRPASGRGPAPTTCSSWRTTTTCATTSPRHLVSDYDVVSVRDGVEALEHLRARRPSIVLADVMMPRMDGPDARPRDPLGPVACAICRWCCCRRGPVWRPARSACSRAPTTTSSSRSSRRELRARLAANLVRVPLALARRRVAPCHPRGHPGALRGRRPRGTRGPGQRRLHTHLRLVPGRRAPRSPPYPWWIPESAHPTSTPSTSDGWGCSSPGSPVEDDRYRILRRGGGRRGSTCGPRACPGTAEHDGFTIVVLRDETREHESGMRRELAARIAVDLATADDLDQVLATAVTGFTVLFDGAVTLRVSPTKHEAVVLSPRGRVVAPMISTPACAPGSSPRPTATTCSSARSGRASCSCRRPTSPTAGPGCSSTSLGSSPATSSSSVTSWPSRSARPSTVSSRSAPGREKERQLEQAIESHRLIGHAVGVLIERHRITPQQGFEMLRQASLNRNVKLRELAARVVESGQDPDKA